MKKIKTRSILIFLFVIFLSTNVLTHPGYGIVVDSNGSIYFTDIARQTIWKLENEKKLLPLVKNVWSHQICLDKKGTLYFTNEEKVSGKNGYSFWSYSSQEKKQLIAPRLRKDFPSDVFALDSNGMLYLADDTKIYKSDSLFNFYPLDFTFESIKSITIGKDNSIYVIDNDKIKRIKDGEVKTIAENLVLKNPPNIPIKNAPNPSSINRLFGLAFDNDGNIYVTYFGNREIIKISKDGKKNFFYKSAEPWVPVGITFHNNFLYIKEHGFKDGNWIGPRIRKMDLHGKPETLVEFK